MYIFLILFSILITYSLFIYNKKENKINDYIKYISISSVLTVFFLHFLILIINGNQVNMNYEFENITPLFIIKYIFLSIISSLLSIMSYKIIKNMTINQNNKLIIKPRMIINLILSGILINLIFTEKYFIDNYDNVPLEQLIFHLKVPIDGTSSSVFIDYFLNSLLPTVILTLIIIFLVIPITKYSLKLKLKKKVYNLFPINFNKKIVTIIMIILNFTTLGYIIYRFDVMGFIRYQTKLSEFIEKNYVDPKNVKIEFPTNKKNLIYIYLESMESTYMDDEHNGVLKNNLIPNLYELAEKEINFSNNSLVGGFSEASYSCWTASSMMAQTSGLPMKFDTLAGIDNMKNGLILPTVVTLGDILEKNGYKNYLYMGSEASFANRDIYFKEHGNYEIFDYNEAIKEGKIDEDYHVWWGFEDKKLIEFAKEKLSNISKSDEPFNFTMLTVDMHPNGGYLDETCEEKYEKNIENVISCNDQMISNFIDWIKNQDFYNDTTIIIVGDHLNMDSSFIESENDRYVYNTIINSSIDPINEKNRTFNTLDMFPTTLASIGVEIKGDRLGLGTNMFSNKETFAEKYSIEYINSEIYKKSKFYQKLISERSEKNEK